MNFFVAEDTAAECLRYLATGSVAAEGSLRPGQEPSLIYSRPATKFPFTLPAACGTC